MTERDCPAVGVMTLITFVMGYILSYSLNFHVERPVVRRLIYIAAVLPLFVSNIVRSFGWIVLLGREGVINEVFVWLGIFSAPVQLLYTSGSVIVTLSYVMLPFMILTLNSVFQNINPSLMEAARDLGAGPIVTFLKVTFPLSLPGVVAGSLSVSAYVTPSVMSGGRLMVMPILIYDYYMVQLDFSMGATLAMMLLMASISVEASTCSFSSAIRARLGRDAVYTSRPGIGSRVLMAASGFVLFFLLAPLLVVIGVSFTASNFLRFPPEGFP